MARKAAPPASLKRYREKRDFSKTAEPAPEVAAKRASKLPMLVVQKHDATRLHWDLRLEADGVLKSWAVTKGPSLDPQDRRLAVRTEESAFLSVRRGDETVCLIREDGAFPIRSFVLSEGVRFPLGVASAGLAILAALLVDTLLLPRLPAVKRLVS